MKLAFLNIKKMIRSKNEVFFVLVFSQIISVVLIFLAYGIFVSYHISKEKWNDSSEEVYLSFSDYEKKRMGEVREGFEELLTQLGERLEFVYVVGINTDDALVEMRMEFKDGKPTFPFQTTKHIILTAGRYFSEEENKIGASVVVGENIGTVGEDYEIAGELFQLIGTDIVSGAGNNARKRIQIPYKSCPDGVLMRSLVFDFKGLPREKDYETIKNVMSNIYDEEFYMDEFVLKDVQKMIAQNSVMIYSVIVMLIIAIDTCLLYSYIFAKRKRDTAIYGLTGAKNGRIFRILLLEILTISVGTLVVGFLIFKVFLEDFIIDLYNNLFDIYTVANYLKLSGAYLLLILIPAMCMTSLYVRQGILKRLKRR